jgi:hypothetical protein
LSLSPLLVLIAALAQTPEGGADSGQDDGGEDGAPVATAPAQPARAPGEELVPPTPSAPLPYEARSIRPFEMTATVPPAPVPYAPGVTDHIPDAPVTVDAYRHSYEGPPSSVEKAYEAGVKRNFDAQQVRMGPLDGSWMVRTQAGAPFMAMMLADRGRTDSEIEGAWRSLGGRPGSGHTGFLLSVAREGQTLVVRWYPSDDTGNINIMRLKPSPDGRWTGSVTARDVEFPVTMSRGPTAGPVLTPTN